MMRKYFMVSVVLVAMSALLVGCNDSTTAPVILEDEAPIAAPANIVAQVTAAGVLITWDASSHPGLRGYNVYRYDRSTGSVAQLNAGVVASNQYVDDSAQWRSHYQYRVTSLSRSSESTFTSVEVDYRSSREKHPKDLEK